jgi:cysteinyl-tRNA synthetase
MKANHILKYMNTGEDLAYAGRQTGSADIDIKRLCQAMDDARAAKDFPKSDAIRKELEDAGYDVKTTKEGTVASKRLA